MMRKLNHPHLIYPLAAFTSGDTLGFLLPWAEAGDDERLGWVLNQIYGLCRATEALHEKNYRHTDLNPQNILVFTEGAQSRKEINNAKTGIRRYEAPELGVGALSRVFDMAKKTKAERAASTAKARAALADKKRKEREGEGEEGGGTPPAPTPEPEGPEPKKAKTNKPDKGKKPAGGGGAEEGRDSESATPAPPSARKPRQGRKQKAEALKAEGREEEQLPPLGDTICLLCLRSARTGMSSGVCAPGTEQGGKCAPCKEKKKPCEPAPLLVSGPGLRFLQALRDGADESVLGPRRTALREALKAHDEAEAKAKAKAEAEAKAAKAAAKAKAKAEGESGGEAAAETAAPLPVPAIAPSVEIAAEDALVSGGSRAGPSSEATPSVSEAAGIRAAIDSFVGGYLPKEMKPAYEVLMDNYASALRGRK
ncbi:protein kinase domain-containing protein [Colletotrichum asianum]|uniref:Protein kinase domain-containing protein n=1 Tax=Colletotrichum asianum TaxID=702518 RepID=A0A8H3VXR7_9PEZI|nr:protein kinase domain-containing protein [Colletotrichum asianum]